MSTDREIRMGEAVAQRLEEEQELSHDPERLARLGQRVADVSEAITAGPFVWIFRTVPIASPRQAIGGADRGWERRKPCLFR